MKTFLSYIIEASGEQIRQYYEDIPLQVYNKILVADPSAIVKKNEVAKVGKFGKILLGWYRKKEFPLDTLSSKLRTFKGNLAKYKTYNDFVKDQSTSDVKVLYQDADWVIEQVSTYETSCSRYGDITSWCTASESYGDEYWNDYNKNGDLFVIRSKKAPNKELYQLYIAKNKTDAEFQDKRNKNDLDVEDFFDEYPKIKDYFVKKQGLKEVLSIKIAGRRIGYEIKGGIPHFYHFNLSDANLTELPQVLKDLGDYTVERSFICRDNKLTSLEGSPIKVGTGFNCSHNQLTSLKGSPKEVGDYFHCSGNNLTTLEGSPKTVSGEFDCYDNELTTLEGSPTYVGRDFDAVHSNLTSLKGSPKEVGGTFYVSHNKLTSLEGAPKKVGGKFFCLYNKKQFTLEDVEKVSNVKGKIITHESK